MKVNFKELEDYLAKLGYPYNKMMPNSTFEIPDETAYEYLMNNMTDYLNVDAMTFYGRKIKYSEFAQSINDTANGLKGIGQTNGDRVATLLPNIPEAAYIQYGASKIGSVPSNIDPRINSKMLLQYVKNEHIKNIVVVDVMYESAIRPVERELKELYGIDKVIVVPATNSLPSVLKGVVSLKSKLNGKKPIKSDILDVIYWDDMINNTKFENANNVGFEPNKEAVIEHSSGTSNGLPKSIPLTNENINSFVEKHRPTIFGTLPHGTKMLNILPYFAAYGAINCSHLGFNMGLTLQQIPEFKFADFASIAAKQKSEILIGTPTWYALAAKDLRLKKDSLKNVKMAISGGDSIDEKTKNEVNQFLKVHGAQCELTNGHGMSELSGSGCYQFPGYINGVNVGIPFPYDKYVIVDKAGNVVPLGKDGAKGCTWIYTPSATDGIFENNRFAETMDINGFRFLNSKDTMFISSNYEITFIGREDRAFTRFDGHKIVPFDIENKFKDNEFVKQCMVVPYYDYDINGKMPIAYVVPTKDLTAEEQDNLVHSVVDKMFNSDDTNDRDIPRKVCFLSELPITPGSKNDYNALINRLLDGNEYTVDIDETNLSVQDIKIISPNRGKTRVLTTKQKRI